MTAIGEGVIGRMVTAAACAVIALAVHGCDSRGRVYDKKRDLLEARQERVAPATTTTTTAPVAAATETSTEAPPDAAPPEQTAEAPGDEKGWKVLFDGKSLDGWKSTAFGGEGELRIENGELIIPAGATLSGITYTGEDLPKTNYEFEVEARRRGGSDFFCGLTFPVADAHASLLCGGWGGSLVGISNIDGLDASENNTTKYVKFEKERWYKIRQRVTDERLQSWIDDEQLVDVPIKNRKINVRVEVRPSRPLGVATWQTDGGVRSIKLRELTPDEVKATNETPPR